MASDSFETGSGDNGTEGFVFVDPGAIDASGARPSEPAAPARTRRQRSDAGQPRGSRSASGTGTRSRQTQKVSGHIDLSALDGVAVAVYMGLARLSKCPEWEITQEEAENFRKKAENVARHYSVEATQKSLDWAAFAMVFGMMNVTRLLVISERKKEERLANAQPRPSAQVFNLNRETVQPSSPEVQISPDDLMGQIGI